MDNLADQYDFVESVRIGRQVCHLALVRLCLHGRFVQQGLLILLIDSCVLGSVLNLVILSLKD